MDWTGNFGFKILGGGFRAYLRADAGVPETLEWEVVRATCRCCINLHCACLHCVANVDCLVDVLCEDTAL